jgi:hypothetical protein
MITVLNFYWRTFMKHLFLLSRSGMQSKVLALLMAGALPLLTNCTKAKFDETAQKPIYQPAPIPQLAPQSQAPQAPKQIGPQAQQPSAEVPPFIDNLGPRASDTDDRDRKRAPKTTAANQSDQNPPIQITIGNTSEPCPTACSGGSVRRVETQIQRPVKIQPISTVPCVGGKCTLTSYTQTYANPVSQVDILFAFDSNVNLGNQKFALNSKIRSFIERLPRLDYNIAVLNTQDATSSFFSPPSNPEKIVHANLTGSDREAVVDHVVRDMFDRVAALNSASFVGTSDAVLKQLDFAVSGNELLSNQAKGFFRPGAGLVIMMMTDERVGNLISKSNTCVERDQAREIYSKIARTKSLGIDPTTLIEAYSPMTFIGFEMMDSDAAMNANQKHSETLELLHLGDAFVFDLAKASSNPELMAAELRFSADRVSAAWMKRNIQVRSQTQLDPSSVCLVANGHLIPTNFVPEINEIRMASDTALRYMPSQGAQTKIEVLYCENGQTRNNSRYNEFAINPDCQTRLESFKSFGK